MATNEEKATDAAISVVNTGYKIVKGYIDENRPNGIKQAQEQLRRIQNRQVNL